jgi:hypothetical protein
MRVDARGIVEFSRLLWGTLTIRRFNAPRQSCHSVSSLTSRLLWLHAVSVLRTFHPRWRQTVELHNAARVLVVDDYEPWRRFVRLTLQIRPELHIIGEASDGLEAI